MPTAEIISKSGLGRFQIVRKSGKWVRSKIKTNFIEIEDNKMYLDPFDSLNLSTKKSFEKFETQMVKKTIKQGDVVLDLGANIGYYTLIFAKLVGETGKVFAFEPEFQNFNILKKNIKLNGYTNVTPINKAVSDKSEKIRLNLDSKNNAAHTIGNKINTKKFLDIDAVSLDDFLNLEKIDFIKMDVEGAEVKALKGMSLLLHKFENVKLLIEFNPLVLKEFPVTTEEYFDMIKSFDFEIYELDRIGEKLLKVKSSDDLTKYKDTMVTNLWCIKKEKIQENSDIRGSKSSLSYL